MTRMPVSDDVCERLVASRDPIDVTRLQDEAVAHASRRLRDELLVELAGELSSRQLSAGSRRRRGFGVAGGRVAVAATVTAVVAVGVFAMVGWLPVGGGHDGPLDAPSASAAVVLDRAAQVAMRSANVATGAGEYGFLKVETASVVGTGSAVGTRTPRWNVWARTTEVKSDWYRADGSGRVRRHLR